MHIRRNVGKRGITPIIATVLLIVLTLIGGGVVAYFAVPAVKQVDSSCLEAINRLTFEDVGYNCRLSQTQDPQARGALEGFSIRIAGDDIIGFQVGFQDEGNADTYRVTSGVSLNSVCVLGSDFNQPLTLPASGGVQTYIARGAHEKIYIAPILKSGKSCFTEARKEVIVSNSCADPAVRNAMLGCYPDQGQPYCGDGTVNQPSEQCDTTAVACTTTLGYAGTQACDSNCQLSPVCNSAGICGNNVVEGPEECDGTPGCSTSCTEMHIDTVVWDESIVNHGDPAGITMGGRDIGGQQIEVYVYEDDLIGDTLMTPEPLVGTYPLAAPLHLSWTAVWQCEIELFGLCIDQPEYIAVARLVNANIVSSSTAVELRVNPAPAMCGNGAIESGEDCDPSTPTCNPLYGGSCGYCSSSCHLITLQGAYCGDGIRNGPEQCDGLDLGGHSCTTLGQGFTQGTLSCSGSCNFNTAACSTSTTPPSGTIPVCGDGIQEGTEECDDGNGDNGDACTNQCTAAYCGDGYLRAGVEMCEPIGSSCNLPGGSSGTLITGNAVNEGTGPGGAGTPGEEVDDGETNPMGTCSASCQCTP